MTTTSIAPIPLPAARILGVATEDRRRLLACVDVVVGYVTARHRLSLAGWRLEAALVESRFSFRGGETVALRAMPLDGRSPSDLPPVPLGVLREIGSRITESINGIANVVPDLASPAPDVEGLFAIIDEDGWDEGAQIA
jgi:GMP synthase PP-ATPase subunit